MRRREYLLWAALLLSGCLWLTGFSPKGGAGRTRWEYMTVHAHDYEGLSRQNRAGEEGWELVSIAPAGPNPADPRIYYFKRAK